jgi:hypothetical protein
MKKHEKISSCNEDGFVMIASLLILLVLTMLGIAVNKNTTTEWQIAMNDRLHKETFYLADAAAELTFDVVAQNCDCRSADCRISGAEGTNNDIGIVKSNFLQSFAEGGTLVLIPSDNARDIVFPAIFNNTSVVNEKDTNEQPHANINVGRDTELPEGSAIQMAAGYEGLGKGIGSNPSFKYYINVQQIGKNGSVSVLCTQYRLTGALSSNCDIYR